MIGWMIVVSTQTPEERDSATQDAKKAAVLAQWETGPGGTAWLEGLTAAGKGTKLYGGGYPSRYTAKAGDVLPLLVSGPPTDSGPTIIGDDYVMPWNSPNTITLAADLIAACGADHVLTIDAWDLS